MNLADERRVDPMEIEHQRDLGWPDFHPERFCHRCGNRNVWAWSVNSKEWNRAVRDRAAILCPTCFTEMHEAVTGEPSVWNLVREVAN